MSAEMEQGQATQQPQAMLAPTTQAVSFLPGLYLFTVRTASPKPAVGAGGILLPALQVSVSPGSPAGLLEFVGLPGANSVWLVNVGDSAVVRVHGESAVVLLNSIRVAGDTQAFDIQVDRLDSQVVAQSPSAAAVASPGLRLKIGLHLLRQGDVEFVAADWAGRAGSGAWVESFSINPLEGIRPTELEYKGLSANGFETPWLQAGSNCGTKGMNIPLIGFAIRLKGQAASRYECEYSAIFRSGAVLGPFRNGVPCRSKSANDPIDAIQVRIVQRGSSSVAKTAVSSASAGKKSKPQVSKGPKFGKLREATVKSTKAATKSTKAPKKAVKSTLKKVAKPLATPAKKLVGKKSLSAAAIKKGLPGKLSKVAKASKTPAKKLKKKGK